MSNLTSPCPSKPSDCDSEEWRSMTAALCSNQVINNTIYNNSEKDHTLLNEVLDIENMEVLYSFPGNGSTQDIQENTKLVGLEIDAIDVPDEINKRLEINEESSTVSEEKSLTMTRKKRRTPSKWKQNDRRDKRQRGECYINSKGDVQEKKYFKEATCHSSKCYYKCAIKITHDERIQQNKYFWTLSDQRKSHFYSKHVIRYLAKRKRTNKENSKKTYSYEYFFEVNGVRMRVCQNYFINTLNISKRRIYYFFNNIQQKDTNQPRELLSGKHIIKKVVCPERKNEIRLHIESFPVIESHYCRSTSKKKYLDRNLNITKMYNLYLPTSKDPVCFQTYSDIFNYEYNLSFFKPKKDLCDRCEEFKVIREPTEKQIFDNEEHLRRKKIGKDERERDRIRCKTNVDDSTCVVTYDLQNVFSLPKAYVGGYYYKSKLNTYNLTGHCTLNNCVYNAIWHEYICGRGGTHLASALIKILKAVVNDNPKLTKIILWSDSYVPQNRNSILSFALQHFLLSDASKGLKVIEHKYSEPGHGTIQEIDCAHSCIEKYIRNLEIWPPLSLIRILTHMPTHLKMHFKVLQMTPNDYLSYQKSSVNFSYNIIPYSKLKYLVYEKSFIWNIKYKQSFEGKFEIAKLSYKKTRGKDLNDQLAFPQNINILSEINVGLSEVKKKALQEMLPQMPDNEKVFYQVLLDKTKTHSLTNKKETIKNKQKVNNDKKKSVIAKKIK